MEEQEEEEAEEEEGEEEDEEVEEDEEEEEGDDEEETLKDENNNLSTVQSGAGTSSNGEENEEENDGGGDEEEVFENLIEPFTKTQLSDLLKEAAEKHPDVLESIRKLADVDPVHRKIFVHGLGWDTTAETLISVFKKYGEIEDCKAVCDKGTGKSKGYAFILFKRRSSAKKALKEPQKKIGNRMTACQLASAGPAPAPAAAVATPPVSEYTARKIYVSNVGAEVDPQKLLAFFSRFGDIEEGPLGLDKVTGKPKGFALFVYKSTESAKKALEEPHKTFDGTVLHCQKAVDGPKPSKPYFTPHQSNPQGGGHGHGHGRSGRGSHYPRHDNHKYSGGAGSHMPAAVPAGGHLMAQPYNPGHAQGINPVLGQALTALLASQGGAAGLGMANLFGMGAPVNPSVQMQGGYGSQPGALGSSAMAGYGSQPGVQGGYQNPQMGQPNAGRSHQGGGHIGGIPPYMGH
ncbi:hypothetical protein MKW94_023934 [Papaver nudicaule]|uniref:RRM domain-containing protein n=1 Tax=Papaver nudicaule TaxID=74823 RepID=A0AA41UX80_PAPNU|nr:hypothetical protein [Papaver nudicaule]